MATSDVDHAAAADERLDVGGGAQVGDHLLGGRAPSRARQDVGAAARQHEPRAALVQRAGDRVAEPAGGAGDEDAAVAKLHGSDNATSAGAT